MQSLHATELYRTKLLPGPLRTNYNLYLALLKVSYWSVLERDATCEYPVLLLLA